MENIKSNRVDLRTADQQIFFLKCEIVRRWIGVNGVTSNCGRVICVMVEQRACSDIAEERNGLIHAG